LQAVNTQISEESSPIIPGDERGARILAKTIYRELRGSGVDEREVIAIATRLLGLATDDLSDG
jgi:hypothetical protein